nr:speckle-type POZ protein-like A [Parasteatoda tepidariorum]
MLLEKEHADLNLHAGKEIIPVHKCLLSARSPVFSAMFKRDMMENQTGVVDIPDVESEVLCSFVEYLYTDIFSNTDFDHVLNLLLVADKYQINRKAIAQCSQGAYRMKNPQFCDQQADRGDKVSIALMPPLLPGQADTYQSDGPKDRTPVFITFKCLIY